jgi:hypothetical protein
MGYLLFLQKCLLGNLVEVLTLFWKWCIIIVACFVRMYSPIVTSYS